MTSDASSILQQAIDAGVDIELLEHNLTLTAEERALQHDAALALLLQFKHAGEASRANADVVA